MKQSEVGDLLALMAAFDRRTVGVGDVLAWSSLETLQRTDFETARKAVLLFFETEPPDRGQAPYLDPHELRKYIRLARDREEIERARESARRGITRGPADPRPKDWNDLVAEAAARARAETQTEDVYTAQVKSPAGQFGAMP